MKRFLSMLISFVLICSFSLNVFAQDGSSSGYLTIAYIGAVATLARSFSDTVSGK